MMKSILSENKMSQVPVSKISNELFDFRDDQREKEDKSSEEFHHLKQSIQTQGLLSPITLTPNKKKKDGTYLLVDGRRRFAAAQDIGLETVPAIIVENRNENELAIITLTQNIHRKDLTVTEKTKAIIKIFEMYGYRRDEIMSECSKLVAIQKNPSPSRIRRADKTEVDIQVNKIIESLGFSPQYVLMMVQIFRDLPEYILEKADQAGLSLAHKQLLVHKTFRKHPEIQETLVEHFSNEPEYKDMDKARQHAEEYKRNIEIGAYRKNEETDKYEWDHSLIQSRGDLLSGDAPEIVPTASSKYRNLLVATSDFLDEFTDYALSKSGDTDYIKEHIKHTEQFRIDTLKEMSLDEVLPLRYNIILIQQVCKNTLDIIEKQHPGDFNNSS